MAHYLLAPMSQKSPALSSRVDGGPGWSVERVALGVGETVYVGDGDHATVVSGPGRGAIVGEGTFVASAPTVIVVVRLG